MNALTIGKTTAEAGNDRTYEQGVIDGRSQAEAESEEVGSELISAISGTPVSPFWLRVGLIALAAASLVAVPLIYTHASKTIDHQEALGEFCTSHSSEALCAGVDKDGRL